VTASLTWTRPTLPFCSQPGYCDASRRSGLAGSRNRDGHELSVDRPRNNL